MEHSLKKRNHSLDLLGVSPAFLFILSILLVRLHLFSMPLSNIFWTEASDTTVNEDLFSYWKSVSIIRRVLAVGGIFYMFLRFFMCYAH